ncbi:cation:proton antiporter [Methanolobus sp. ZRKC3]|uniref:cation:proton antiporter n=1 Tax=Methanolobus sp. ZRKC3 TaxID=3125786 RepID=UPI003243E434
MNIGILHVALVFMALAIIPCIYRIMKGPSIPDRVVGLDAMTTVIVVMLGVYSFVQESVFFLDVALALSIISFVGTVAIARYLDEGVVF